MRTAVRIALVAAFALTFGSAVQARSHRHFGRSGTVPPSTSHTVNGLRVPR